MNVRHVSTRQAIDMIAANARIQLVYRYDFLDAQRAPIDVRVSRMPAGEVLSQVLAGTGLHVVAVNGAIFSIEPISSTTSSTAIRQIVTGVITGRVQDATSKQPVKGARITLDGATHGVVTNEDGRYRLPTVAMGSHTMTVSSIGYARQTRRFTVTDTALVTLDVLLDPSTNQLDQVVVTGTVVPTERKAVPNAMTVITAKDIEQRGITHIDQLFRGDVPGVFAMNTGDQLGKVTLFSRGVTEMLAYSPPAQGLKTYVDGVELADPSYLSQIDPASVEKIEILTGPQASTIYGSNAINGVMQIFTKRGSSTSRPQVTATLQGGVVQNSLSAARTPQHIDGLSVNGTDGHLSYNVGGSWEFIGQWAPGQRLARTSEFAGGRLLSGPLTIDGSLRFATSRNQATGFSQEDLYKDYSNGVYDIITTFGVAARFANVLSGTTLGTTMTYAPTSWWSHQVILGSDVSSVQNTQLDAVHSDPSDTAFSYSLTTSRRKSIGYSTTLRMSLLPAAQDILTLGADGWNNEATSLEGSAMRLAALSSGNGDNLALVRQPGHNRGMFVQDQLAVWDALFLTYGLRLEWNPAYGRNAEPNVAPRYGIAYSRDLGPITAKVRASYGRSTRPPSPSEKVGITAVQSGNFGPVTLANYGDFWYQIPNADLGPEAQQGGEGGLELYFGNYGSLVVTRYDETVDNLIYRIYPADSARSLTPIDPRKVFHNSIDAQGYGYRYEYENINVGRIGNQGWELQGTVNAGPFTTKGTYSWTRSRVLTVNPRYQSILTATSFFAPGATFWYLPEHTWALTTTYAQRSMRLSLTLNGIGATKNDNALDLTSPGGSPLARLGINNSFRRDFPAGFVVQHSGYVTADMNASQQLSSRVQGILEIKNVSNYFRNDYYDGATVLGRQTLGGFRVMW